MKEIVAKSFIDNCLGVYKLKYDDEKLIDISKIGENDKYDYIILPPIVDIHTHGMLGLSSETEKLCELSSNYLSRGVGGYLATIGPRSYEKYRELFYKYRNFKKAQSSGAVFLGVHLEGPHLNKDKCGAIDPNNIYDIDIDKFESFVKENNDLIKIMTIAPETKNASKAIEILVKNGIIPSFGHTKCNYELACSLFDKYQVNITHTFNAMNSLHHRDPNMITAALLYETATCEVIGDGYHLQLPIIKLLLRLKNKNNIIFVSDGGEESGYQYKEGFKFSDGSTVKGGAIIREDGVVAGSTKDLANVINY
ncbi:MAG: hypothetical protein MR210_00740, partial [Erysipelotrichaceae bacterium]|nr:hypothetical protein [Erysipelotrichaceae bacterium]